MTESSPYRLLDRVDEDPPWAYPRWLRVLAAAFYATVLGIALGYVFEYRTVAVLLRALTGVLLVFAFVHGGILLERRTVQRILASLGPGSRRHGAPQVARFRVLREPGDARANAVRALEPDGRDVHVGERSVTAWFRTPIAPGIRDAHTHVEIAIERDPRGGSQVIVTAASAQHDFGGARALVDAFCTRFEAGLQDVHAMAHETASRVLPRGAMAAVTTLGRAGSVRSLAPALDGWRVGLADGDAVIVMNVPATLDAAAARRVARDAGARHAERSHGGAGFIVLPLAPDEDALRIGEALRQSLQTHAHGYRGGIRVDASTPDDRERTRASRPPPSRLRSRS